ncbi:vacuolar membrane PQ loop repeat protein [Pseudovirgaria hyperparasitica]|uniref:Vacuolar membrane PQ loop repeat protein n=1 Tax=Pseudovirgaria hyperparasitica TaxID=470096 RepID=A0A6A6WAU4_9PEZI|nr:vacuolar membrane PQ loop repeat protein [Pseudovirgaria hyperparasitica]KAF2759793.1 vacuolar membrane PQ loop repeat protein [Pseudovirgaria hyperparasitica]
MMAMSLAAAAQDIHLTAPEALSGIFGSISLVCWIFVLVPQLIENYKQGSAEAVSLAFIVVWFVGDIANLIGAIWAGLVPTVILIAVYFCFSDLALITQCVYYNVKNARKERKLSTRSNGTYDSEDEPLLSRRDSDNTGLPGSHRRKSSAASRLHRESVNRRDSLASIVEEETGGREWLKNTLCVVGILTVGTGAWAIAWSSGVWKPVPVVTDPQPMPIGAEILGYGSAVCYLGARIPQIIKNYRDKSCEGLSLLFFMLSLTGNLTYGAGILFHSTDKEYFLTNLPWLIGSLGTMVEDVTIFAQFRIYGDQSPFAVE